MFSLTVFLWIVVAMFGFIGFMRLWQREILVTAALVLVLFTLDLVNSNNRVVDVLIKPVDANASPADRERNSMSRFLVTTAPMLFFLAVGYAGPILASGLRPDRFPNKARSELQEGFVGFMLGALNGFLVISTLVYYARRLGVLIDGNYPPTSPTPILTMPTGGWEKFFFYQASVLELLSPFTLALVMVVVFLFLLVALL
jgi:hypothetical protein